MCGRFTLTDPSRLEREFGRRFRFAEVSDTRARYNIAPTQPVLGVGNGRSDVQTFRWGLNERINARVETISTRPPMNRCIIFADGFFEWNERRQPMYFTLASGAPFAFAGILSPRGEAAAVVTCPPNELVGTIHNRMPVILAGDAIDTWLTAGALAAAEMLAVLRPWPACEMRVRRVSSRLNSARYDAPDLLLDSDPVQESLF